MWPCWKKCVIRGGLWGFKCSSQAQCLSLPVSLLPANPDEELLVPSPLPCLPAHCHASCNGDNGLNLWTCKPAPVWCCPLLESLDVSSLPSNRNCKTRAVNIQPGPSLHSCWPFLVIIAHCFIACFLNKMYPHRFFLGFKVLNIILKSWRWLLASLFPLGHPLLESWKLLDICESHDLTFRGGGLPELS